MTNPMLPEPPAEPTWWSRNGERVWKVGGLLATYALVVLATRFGWPAPPPIIVQAEPEDRPALVAAGPEAPADNATGWHHDPAVAAAALADVDRHFDRTPAGRAALGDEDVFLWNAVRKVANRGPPWYPNINQGPVGCCVGAGWKHAVDVCQASQILSGRRAEWKPVSAEMIYAVSRIDVGRGQIRGDGSVGDWARQAVEKFGVVPMEKVGGTDLTEFSPQRAKDWGSRGAPSDVKAAGRDHLVKASTLVKTWADVKRAIQQGYPIAVCSNQGFVMQRDRNGFARPSGTWAHCMSIHAVRVNPPGAFVLNNWGDDAHTGPVWPPDMPVAGFWADPQTIERMVAMGDSYALSDVAGFPARVPDWFIRVPVIRDRFPGAMFALAW